MPARHGTAAQIPSSATGGVTGERMLKFHTAAEVSAEDAETPPWRVCPWVVDGSIIRM